MRTITISSETAVFPRLSPSFASSQFSSKTKIAQRFSTLACYRRSRQFGTNLDDERVRHYLQMDSEDALAQELRVHTSDRTEVSKPMHNMDDHIMSGESLFTQSLRRKNELPADCSSFLKFMLLCGVFTLEGTRQAVAGADFTAGLQSVSLLGDLGDISSGFASAFLLIFFSELGDKTFFIAALLAARNSAVVTFIGTFGALSVMSVISVVLGRTFHYVDDIIPFRFGNTDLPIDDIAAVVLLVYFGVSTLLEASSGDGMKAEEEQKEAELAVSELRGNGAGILAAANTVASTFFLVFVAEWGDKSFFSTIALAAASSPLGVIGGALAGHGLATLLAVLGGSLLGNFLSEKIIAYIGGSLFLVFAAVTLIEILN